MHNPLTGMRQTLRNLVRTPSFTLSAVLTLALGMAATTVVFSTSYHLVLRPLPFDDWQNLSFVYQQQSGGTLTMGPSPALAREAMEHSTSFSALAIWTASEHGLTGRGEPVMLNGASISAGLPDLLGVRPLLGRSFTAEEIRNGDQVVLLGEELWRTRFGGDHGVIGSTVKLGPDTWTVIGVMPSRFARYQTLGEAHEYWLPLRVEDVRRTVSLAGRLRPGVAPDVAAAELDAIAAALPPGDGSTGPGWGYTLKGAGEFGTMGMNASRVLPRLFGAAALLLLIGCANVAGLLLIRTHTRRREFAVRTALGARRSHLLIDLVTEQVMIGLAAGVLGVVMAVWGVDLIRAIRPDRLASLDHVAVNLPVLAFAAGLVMITTLVFGALPAVAVMRGDIAGSMQSAGGPRLTAGTRTRSVLVTLQLALATMLLVGGFLLVRTVQQLERQELGFNTANLLVADVPLPAYRYDAETREGLLHDFVQSLSDLEGVQSAAFSNGAPPDMGLMFVPKLEVEGSDVSTEGIQFLRGAGISPGFLATLGARMVEGREYSVTTPDPFNVVVSRAFSERFWPGQGAVGRRFRLSQEDSWQTVIGVVDDIRADGGVHAMGELLMFWPMSYGFPGGTVIIRTTGSPLALAPALRQVLARLDADLPIRELGTMEQRMSGVLASQRFNMFMIGLFAAAAALLCAVGLYALVSFSFEQRVREVGVRMALGATPSGIRSLFMTQAVRIAAIGVPLGLFGAFASATFIAALVHGVSPRDPLAYAAAFAVICLVVLPAGWLPARRASRTQPVTALRQQ
ncbi:ABC transporter permease [soil metagenome]